MKTNFGTSEILSKRKTAAYLGIYLTSLDHLGIPRTKVEHRVMFKREVLNRWIDEHMEKRKENVKV